MMRGNDKITCDAEVGRNGNWHGCGANASWAIDTASGLQLHYCSVHKLTRKSPLHFVPAPFAKWHKINQD